MDTTTLQPCPFCGSPKASLDGSVGGAFVSCDLCEARGPFVEYEQVNYPASMFKSVSVAPNGDAIDPPVKVVGPSNDEYLELRNKAARAAEIAAIAAWNRRAEGDPLRLAMDHARTLLRATEGGERLPAGAVGVQLALLDLLSQVESCDGTAQIDTEKAELALADWHKRSAWQPIETAPRVSKASDSGTPVEILVWDGDEITVVLCSPFYAPRYTHWQPLPSPPASPAA